MLKFYANIRLIALETKKGSLTLLQMYWEYKVENIVLSVHLRYCYTYKVSREVGNWSEKNHVSGREKNKKKS